MDNKGISKAVINRLPRYYRYLGLLLDQGTERISSGELSRRMNSSMDLSRLQSAVNEEERVRQNLYRAIGEQYAALHKNDPEEALAGLMAEVQASFKRTEEYHGMIRTMKARIR